MTGKQVIFKESLAQKVPSPAREGLRIQPDYAYRVALSKDRESIQWIEAQGSQQNVVTKEPGAALWLRCASWLLSLLPLESEI